MDEFMPPGLLPDGCGVEGWGHATRLGNATLGPKPRSAVTSEMRGP